jgi:7-cyano-7-deazaguanine synthase
MAVRSLNLLSGGPDSAVAAYLAVSEGKEVHTLTLKSSPRGHNHIEVGCAERLAKHLGVKNTVIDISGIAPLFDNKPGYKFAVGGARDCLPEGQIVAPLSVELMHLLCCMYAASNGIDRFVWPIHKKDIDCDLDWERAAVEHFEKMVETRIGHRIVCEMPLLEMTKSEVIQLGERLGVPWGETFSCFVSQTETHCGRCYKCHERRTQFAEAGVHDPVRYEHEDDYVERSGKRRYYNIPDFA